MDYSRQKAKAGQIYNINNTDYITLDTMSGCQGCVSDCENSEPKCTDFPLCSTESLSVIFIKVEK
jgi:hypothetical protein